MKMGTVHKEVGLLLTEAAESKSDQEVIKAVALKNKEIIAQLKTNFGGLGSTGALMEQVEVR